MGRSFLHLSMEEQSEVLRLGASHLNKSAIILEKDVWICWSLRNLFSIPDRPKMCFKGGTALSKAYTAINRFSEDIDVTVDFKELAGEDLREVTTRSQAKILSETLRKKLTDYLAHTVTPFLERRAKMEFPQRAIKFRIAGDQNENVIIDYDTALDDEPGSAYIANTVRLEFGGRNLTEPSALHRIVPYLKFDLFPDLDFPEAAVDVLAMQRTFWEKATAIHAECKRIPPRLPERFSRHWSDLIKIIEHAEGEKCIADRAVFQSVVDHKKLFFYNAAFDYDACISGNIKLVPTGAVKESMERDYGQMVEEQMFYETPPTLKALMSDIEKLEKRINELYAATSGPD